MGPASVDVRCYLDTTLDRLVDIHFLEHLYHTLDHLIHIDLLNLFLEDLPIIVNRLLYFLDLGYSACEVKLLDSLE